MSYNGRLTSLSHGGGCGCKIAPGILSDILKASPLRAIPAALLAGSENNEDAAVYQINENQAIVATTDFFMPIVDDPFEFGRIAATNAISDIYAMGAQPLFALASLYARSRIALSFTKSTPINKPPAPSQSVEIFLQKMLACFGSKFPIEEPG